MQTKAKVIRLSVAACVRRVFSTYRVTRLHWGPQLMPGLSPLPAAREELETQLPVLPAPCWLDKYLVNEPSLLHTHKAPKASCGN